MKTVAWEVDCGYRSSQPAFCREPSTAELNECDCSQLVYRWEAEAAIEAARSEVPTAVAAYIEELQFLADNWSESDDLTRAVSAMTPAQRKACGLSEEP